MMPRRYFTGLLTVLLLLALIIEGAQPANSTTLPLYMDAGSEADYVAPDGRRFEADRDWTPGGYGFVNGTKEEVEYAVLFPYPMGGTTIRPVFLTQRKTWREFRASNIPNGQYLVTLYFGADRAHGPDIDLFDLLIEGDQVVSELDVYAHVGRDTALVRRFSAEVTDGELNIEANVRRGVAFISALSIEPRAFDNIPPANPSNVSGAVSYNAAQIDWGDSVEVDLNGYRIYRAPSGSDNFVPITNEPVYISRFEDYSAVPGEVYRYRVTAIDVYGNESGQSSTVAAQAIDPAASTLPVYEIEIDPADWEIINALPFFDKEIPGTFTYEGESYPIELRYRGSGSRLANKKNWKVRFDTVLNSPFPDRDTLNLNADHADPTYMRGALAYDRMAAAGLSVPRAEHVLLFVNGLYRGVYISYEQVDEEFLTGTGRDRGSDIFKANHSLFVDLEDEAAYQDAYRKNNNRGKGFQELIDFVELLNNASDDEIGYYLQKEMDIVGYLKQHLIHIWTGNSDALTQNSYLLRDSETDRWEVVPWDLDLSWGNPFYGFYADATRPIDYGSGYAGALPRRALDVPAYRQYFCRELDSYSQSILSDQSVHREIDILFNQIKADGERDWLKYGWEDSSGFFSSADTLKAYNSERAGYLSEAATSYCDGYDDRPYLKINEIQPQNDGQLCDPDDSDPGRCEESWIEIYNEGLYPVDLNGMTISHGSNSDRIEQSLLVPPLGHILLWADGEPGQGGDHLDFTLDQNGGTVTLSAAGGQIDRFEYDNGAAGVAIGRLPDGSAQLDRFTGPTPAAENVKLKPRVQNVNHTPRFVEAGDTVNFEATVIDEGEVDLFLWYQIDGGGFNRLSMTQMADTLYTATLGPRASGSRIQYYVEAIDRDGMDKTKPKIAPERTYEYWVDYEPPELVINEIVASNANGYEDPDEPGENPDWFELYNPGPFAVNVGGMYVTDRITDTEKYQLGEIEDELIIPAGGHMLILADDDGSEGALHTNFKLSQSGETLALYDRSDFGHSLLSVVTFGPQRTDISLGRCGDGGENWVELSEPSPGRPNRGCPTDGTEPELIGLTQIPQYPLTGQAVTIEAELVDQKAITSARIFYRLNDGPFFAENMVRIGTSNRYAYTLPGFQTAGLTIDYYIEYANLDGVTKIEPFGAPGNWIRLMFHENSVPAYAVPPTVYINEVAPHGTDLADPAEPGEFPDWVELYNPNGWAIDLSGYQMMHDAAYGRSHVLPTGTEIPANGYLLLLADDDAEQGDAHLGFTLNFGGDDIGLYTSAGVEIDRFRYTEEIGERAVFARIRSQEEVTWRVLPCSTPGERNDAQCPGIYLPLVTRSE